MCSAQEVSFLLSFNFQNDQDLSCTVVSLIDCWVQVQGVVANSGLGHTQLGDSAAEASDKNEAALPDEPVADDEPMANAEPVKKRKRKGSNDEPVADDEPVAKEEAVKKRKRKGSNDKPVADDEPVANDQPVKKRNRKGSKDRRKLRKKIAAAIMD